MRCLQAAAQEARASTSFTSGRSELQYVWSSKASRWDTAVPSVCDICDVCDSDLSIVSIGAYAWTMTHMKCALTHTDCCPAYGLMYAKQMQCNNLPFVSCDTSGYQMCRRNHGTDWCCTCWCQWCKSSWKAKQSVNGRLPPHYLVTSAHPWRVMMFENACEGVPCHSACPVTHVIISCLVVSWRRVSHPKCPWVCLSQSDCFVTWWCTYGIRRTAAHMNQGSCIPV